MYFDLKIWLGLVLFRIDVELLFLGLFCNHFFFFSRISVTIFFLKILVQNLFGIKLLRVFLIFLEGVPIFFLIFFLWVNK